MQDLVLQMFGASNFFDMNELTTLVSKFALNFLAAWIVIRGVYVRLYRWNEFVFTYFAFSVITFSICLMLRKVPMELGFALGLFAVFGILRYRTEPIRIRDLTYMFVVIGLAILNALSNAAITVMELVLINGAIVGLTYVAEYHYRNRLREQKLVVYDRLELCHPSRRDELYADLRERVGLNVVGVSVVSADLLRDTAELSVECLPFDRREQTVSIVHERAQLVSTSLIGTED